MKEPLVCIILVNYNGYEDTIECIRSLKDINYSNYKIIVVDNGSTKEPDKNQLEYIKKNSEYLISEENLGFSGGNNFGMRYARKFNPKYFMLLNNDTVVKKDFMGYLVSTAEEKSDAGIVTGKIYYFDPPRHIWYAGGAFDKKTCMVSHLRWDEEDHDFENYVKEITFATGCLWLLPVSVVDKIGEMDESLFLYSEDTEYSCRVIQNGLKIYFCNASVIYHKVSRSTSLLSDLKQYYLIRNDLYIMEKYSSNNKYAKAIRVKDIVKRLLKKTYNIKIVYQAWYDYKNHNMGKNKKEG